VSLFSANPEEQGVWIDVGKSSARKICAIGVKSSRFIPMHGFALNVNTDLEYFKHINPCGFTDKAVTSIKKELGKCRILKRQKKLFCQKWQKFSRRILVDSRPLTIFLFL
jgi:lipoyl(octanoyl) transferase